MKIFWPRFDHRKNNPSLKPTHTHTHTRMGQGQGGMAGMGRGGPPAGMRKKKDDVKVRFACSEGLQSFHFGHAVSMIPALLLRLNPFSLSASRRHFPEGREEEVAATRPDSCRKEEEASQGRIGVLKVAEWCAVRNRLNFPLLCLPSCVHSSFHLHAPRGSNT